MSRPLRRPHLPPPRPGEPHAEPHPFQRLAPGATTVPVIAAAKRRAAIAAESPKHAPADRAPEGVVLPLRAEPDRPVPTQPSCVEPAGPRVSPTLPMAAVERPGPYQARARTDRIPVANAGAPQPIGLALAQQAVPDLADAARVSTYRSVESQVVDSPDLASEESAAGRVTTNPSSVSSVPHERNTTSAWRFTKVFAAALGSSLVVFGGGAWVWNAAHTPNKPTTVAAQRVAGPSSAVAGLGEPPGTSSAARPARVDVPGVSAGAADPEGIATRSWRGSGGSALLQR